MEKQNKYHVLYKTTCTITGNFYIGVHSTINLDDGYLGSGKRLGNSIKKHGKENHYKEILEFFESKEDAYNKEKEIVNEILISDKKCMNLNVGGHGGWSSSMQSKNGEKSNNKKWSLQENRDKQSLKLSDQNKELHRKGILKAPDWTGRKHKQETKDKIGKIISEKQKGEGNSQYGTSWIHNHDLKKSIRIKRELLEKYISEGWIKGMKRCYLNCNKNK